VLCNRCERCPDTCTERRKEAIRHEKNVCGKSLEQYYYDVKNNSLRSVDSCVALWHVTSCYMRTPDETTYYDWPVDGARAAVRCLSSRAVLTQRSSMPFCFRWVVRGEFARLNNRVSQQFSSGSPQNSFDESRRSW